MTVCIGAALTLALCAARAEDDKVDVSKIPPASTKTGVTYATDIKPIFDKSCVKCHSGDKPKGGLKLDSLEGAIKGAKHGKVIVPSKATDSKLLIAVSYLGEEDEFMPPPDNKAKIPRLTPEQVGLIRAWIDQGAK